MKKISKKEKIKIQRTMLQYQAHTLEEMAGKVDDLYHEILTVKAKAFDMLAERG